MLGQLSELFDWGTSSSVPLSAGPCGLLDNRWVIVVEEMGDGWFGPRCRKFEGGDTHLGSVIGQAGSESGRVELIEAGKAADRGLPNLRRRVSKRSACPVGVTGEASSCGDSATQHHIVGHSGTLPARPAQCFGRMVELLAVPRRNDFLKPDTAGVDRGLIH